MNCIWIILLLSLFGGCGCDMGGCCGSGRARNNNCGCNDNRGGRQRGGCRRAVENAVDECGSERAVMRVLKERDGDCGSERAERAEARAERAEAREERAERRAERAERMAEKRSCDMPGHWQDFPGVPSANAQDNCGCDA